MKARRLGTFTSLLTSPGYTPQQQSAITQQSLGAANTAYTFTFWLAALWPPSLWPALGRIAAWPLFAGFLARHPQMSIELITDSRRYNLARREADLVFRITPFDEPDVIQRKLMHMDYALYGRIDLVAPARGDGAGQSLITMDTAFGELPDVAWIRQMLPNAHIAYASNNRGVQARMCAEGGGFAVLPCPLGDNTPGLRRIDHQVRG